MNTSPFVRILLSTLFSTALSSAVLLMPLVLAARDEARMAVAARQAQVWEGSRHAPSKQQQRRDPGPPQAYAPIEKSGGPDAQMIKPGKARAKTIKL